MGIRAMRERANHLGGELKTESEPGQGTKVRFELVLQIGPIGAGNSPKITHLRDALSSPRVYPTV
jgi:hypothetical protein